MFNPFYYPVLVPKTSRNKGYEGDIFMVLYLIILAMFFFYIAG